jgi:hypothetical protein
MRDRVLKAHRSTFDSIVILVTRSIWLQRNDRVFARMALSPGSLAHHIELVADDWCQAKMVDKSQLIRE